MVARARQQRGLIRLDNVDEAAGMLFGMMVFEPQRAALFGHQPLPSRETIEARARSWWRCSCVDVGRDFARGEAGIWNIRIASDENTA